MAQFALHRHLTWKHAAIVLAIGLAGALVWWFVHAHQRKVDAAFETCMREIGSGAEKATADFTARRPGDTEAKSIGDAVTSMMQGIGGAICGNVRENCARDFDGASCQAALARYR
jgi:hypothetical protein